MSGGAPGDGGEPGGRAVSGGTAAFGDAGPRAAAVAHDVNNLLAVIAATAAEALALPGLDEAARQAFAEVGDATGRAAVLLRRLLDPLPLSGGGVAGVDSALRALAAPLRRVLGGVALVVAPGTPGAAVAMEPVDLDRVVLNLVLNARNAMPSSGGTVAVGSELCEVAGVVSRFGDAVVPGRFVVVVVRDTGAGMSPEVMARLFEPFFTTRAGEGGTGLGMAGVRDLVRGAGGFLEVDSAPGRGTTVRVHLPCHEAVPEVAAAPPSTVGAVRAGPAGRGVVLLVDDEAALLRLGERALSRAGWGVVAVAGAAEAMAALEGGAVVPCAAVVDLALPDGDGLALVDALRRRWPGLPAVLTSGYDTAAVRGRAGAAGVGFLAKPFATGALVGRLGEVLQPEG